MIAALRLEVTVREALIDKLTALYVNGSAEPVTASVSRRRRGRPPSDPSERVKKRDAMRAYRARQKAASPVTKPARKRRRKAKAAAKAADPVAANDHVSINMNPVASPVPDPQADLRKRIAKAKTVEQIIDLLAAARALADTAAEKKDRAQYRIGLELRARCERRGGQLIQQITDRGEKFPTSKLGISPVAPRWRDLGKLSEAKFKQRLVWIAKRGLPTVSELSRNDPRPIAPVEMNLTEWQRDENGCLSRKLIASGEAPVLRDENRAV